jgi:hypothetical protein
VILESGSRAFVRGMGDSKEATWFVYRRGPALIEPDSKTTLGYEAIYLGTAQRHAAASRGHLLTSVTQEVASATSWCREQARDTVYAPHAPTRRSRAASSRSTAAAPSWARPAIRR